MKLLNVDRARIAKLNQILAKARISPALRAAIKELIAALRVGNKTLAANLAAVKSFISGSKDPKALKGKTVFMGQVSHFVEDYKYNEKALGGDVYGILDTMAFDLARVADQIPPGMMIFSSGGVGQPVSVSQRAPPRGNGSKTLRLMEQEEREIRRAVEERK